VPDRFGEGDAPAGWEQAAALSWEALRAGLGPDPGVEGEQEGHRCVELCPICRAADVLRAGASPELRGQLGDLQREALLTLRSMIDHYLERIDSEPPAGDRVEEIPIE
jgi:hypothetical protein